METLNRRELNVGQACRYSPDECTRIVTGLITQKPERDELSMVEEQEALERPQGKENALRERRRDEALCDNVR